MFICSKTRAETPVNECSEIHVQKPLFACPNPTPHQQPAKNMCAKFTWVAKTGKVFMRFLFEFTKKHLAQSIAWGSVLIFSFVGFADV